MSFLKKEEQQGWKIGDWVVLILLIGGSLGGWYYYTTSKSNSLADFSTADQLFASGEYVEAMSHYDALQTAAWKNDSLDSLLYARMAQLNEWQTTERELYRVIDSLAIAGDTAQALHRFSQMPTGKFLSPEEHNRLTEIGAFMLSDSLEESAVDSAMVDSETAASPVYVPEVAASDTPAPEKAAP